MTDFSQASAELKVFGAKLRAVLAATDELERVGSLQQAGNEAQGRVDTLVAKESDLKASLATLAGQISDAQGKLEAAIADHKATVASQTQALADIQAGHQSVKDKLTAEAQAEADAIIRHAKANAAQLEDLAHAKAQEIEDVARATEARIASGIASAKQELAKLEDQVAAHTSLKAEIAKSIADLKAKLG